GVMEFLLINHPLDCPICDQAGECQLQEFSVDFGTSKSRFLENKVKKPKNVEIGSRVRLDDERCILCSRCIRFCQEIAHDDVLGFVDRGSYTVLTAHPGKRLEDNYSLNTVDICPVGALTSTDFRFKIRVWFLKETKSICTSCASGRMTNEELWLTSQLAKSLGVQMIDIVPRREPGDDILLSEDRNPNTNGARLVLGSTSEPGAKLMAIAEAVKSGQIKALVMLKEN